MPAAQESNLVHLPTSKLVTLDQIVEAVAEIRRIDQAKEIADKADAVAHYHRQSRASLELQNHAIALGIMARRRIGELLAEMPRQPGPGRGKKSATSSQGFLAQLEEIGISRGEAATCQKLAAIDEDQVVSHISATQARGEKITIASTLNAVSHAAGYQSDEYDTPDELVAAIRGLFGGVIDIDPASNEDAQSRIKAKRWYSKEQNGLSKPWRGKALVNPPYAQPACAQFCDKFIEEAVGTGGRPGPMTHGVLILNASTDTAWWHRLAERFIFAFSKGRTAFVGSDNKPLKGNRVGQVLFFHGFGQPRQIKDHFPSEKWALFGAL